MRLISTLIGLAATLVLFSLMVLTRLLGGEQGERQDVVLQRVEMFEWSPPPPPPPEPETEPEQDLPPPPAPAVPNLAPSPDTDAPTIATTDQPVPMELGFEDFASDTAVAALPTPPKPRAVSRPSRPSRSPAPPKKSSYSLSELDGKPRLLSNPSVRFPRALSRRGVKQGRVVVVVRISPSGRSNLVRIVSASHPELKPAASRIANGSRFTPPKKNGQPVTAVMSWPIIIR